MAKAMWSFRESQALSWLSGPRTNVTTKPPLIGPSFNKVEDNVRSCTKLQLEKVKTIYRFNKLVLDSRGDNNIECFNRETQQYLL
jgi:hypothetical protein